MKAELSNLLMNVEEFVVNESLNKNKLSELARKYDAKLFNLLMKEENVKNHFFTTLEDGVLVFKKDVFLQFLNNKEFLPDSYTSYKTKIGLGTDNGDYISENNDVVLNFPYKDCILEGGQTKEDAKRQEVFFNKTLAPNEINRLLDNKILTNFKRYDRDGENEVVRIEDTDNLIIKGNNLIALHSLKKRFAGKIKLIYIDPPYYFNSMKDADTFSYNSNFKLSTWLVFMKNRLEIAKELLADEGVLLVSISEDGQAYLKVLMDDIFSQNDFVETFIWRNTDNADSLGNKSRSGVEYIHAYEKNKNSSVRWIGKDAENGDAPLINKSNAIGTLKFNPGTIRFNIPDGYYPAGEKNSLKLENELIVENGKNKNVVYLTGRFKWGQEYLDNEVSKGSDFVIKTDKFSIRYQKAEAGNVAPEKFIDDRYLSKIFGVGTNEDANSHLRELNFNFSYSKPESLLAFFIRAITRENDIVLDFFMGSGTTQAVAHKMNRQYIGIEQMDYIETVSVERLKKVIEGEQGGISKDVEWQGGGSFVYCELKNDAQDFLNKVENALSSEQLIELLEKVKKSSFLSYRVDAKKLNKEEFNNLSLFEQKQLLVELIDQNNLYVNYSDIDDVDNNISEKEKQLNTIFYL